MRHFLADKQGAKFRWIFFACAQHNKDNFAIIMTLGINKIEDGDMDWKLFLWYK